MLGPYAPVLAVTLWLVCAVLFGGCSRETATPQAACVELRSRTELHVDANDARQVWATNYESGLDFTVRPRPPGRFAFDGRDARKLLDGDGKMLATNGTTFEGGCMVNGTIYIGRADLPDPNRAPN